jgi:hypothetical protein
MTQAAPAAIKEDRGRPPCAAWKLAASSRKASAVAGDIGAKSAPISRSWEIPKTQPHSANAASSATKP